MLTIAKLVITAVLFAGGVILLPSENTDKIGDDGVLKCKVDADCNDEQNFRCCDSMCLARRIPCM